MEEETIKQIIEEIKKSNKSCKDEKITKKRNEIK